MSTTSSTNFVSALGAGSGIDVKSLAQNLVDAERLPRKERIDGKIKLAESKISGYGAIKYALSQVKTAFEKINDVTDFSTLGASVSQPAALSVKAGATAAEGSYNISIQQIAKAQRVASGVFAIATQPVRGTAPWALHLAVGSAAPISLSVAEDSPQGLARAINAAKLGVSAQVINTGTGARVVLTGQIGAAQAFTATVDDPVVAQVHTQDADSFLVSADAAASKVTATYTDATTQQTVSVPMTRNSGGLWEPSDPVTRPPSDAVVTVAATKPLNLFSQSLQPAQDAQFEVNGLAITRANNSVSDVIDGVTLTLAAPTTGEDGAQVDLQRETTGLKDNLQALVKAYNELDDTVRILGDRQDTSDELSGVLAGDSLLMAVRSQLRAFITQPSNTPRNGITAPRDVGLSFDRYGKLQLDEARLDKALTDNFSDMVQMFTGGTNNASVFSATPAGAAGSAVRALDRMLRTTGIVSTQSQSASKDISKYQKELDELELRMRKLLERYTQQFAVMDNLVGQSNSLRTSLTNTFAAMNKSSNSN